MRGQGARMTLTEWLLAGNLVALIVVAVRVSAVRATNLAIFEALDERFGIVEGIRKKRELDVEIKMSDLATSRTRSA